MQPILRGPVENHKDKQPNIPRCKVMQPLQGKITLSRCYSSRFEGDYAVLCLKGNMVADENKSVVRQAGCMF